MKNYDFPKFTPTEHSTVADKEHFAEQFIRFISKGCRRTMFPKWFYTRLSMTFGHIANFNQNGFYAVFFSDKESTCEFLNQTLHHGCYGDPAYTYSDVEKFLQGWLREYLGGEA